MVFDPEKLPDKKNLTLFEAVTFLAFNEALSVGDFGEAGHPSARPYEPLIDQALERCLNEALSDPECSGFLRLFLPRPLSPPQPSPPLHAPSTAELQQCKDSWPPLGKTLYRAVEQLERAKAKRPKLTERAQIMIEFAQLQKAQERQALKVKKVLDRCIEEALGNPKCAEFLDLIIRKRPRVTPFPAQLKDCEGSWPSTGETLYNLISAHWRAMEEDDAQIEETKLQIDRALRSGSVQFNGERDGVREDIDVRRFDGAPDVDIYTDTVKGASHELGIDAGRTLKWIGVMVDVASLLAWANKNESATRAVSANAFGGETRGSEKLGSPTGSGSRRQSGRPPYTREWEIVFEPLSRAIYVLRGPYDRDAGVNWDTLTEELLPYGKAVESWLYGDNRETFMGHLVQLRNELACLKRDEPTRAAEVTDAEKCLADMEGCLAKLREAPQAQLKLAVSQRWLEKKLTAMVRQMS